MSVWHTRGLYCTGRRRLQAGAGGWLGPSVRCRRCCLLTWRSPGRCSLLAHPGPSLGTLGLCDGWLFGSITSDSPFPAPATRGTVGVREREGGEVRGSRSGEVAIGRGDGGVWAGQAGHGGSSRSGAGVGFGLDPPHPRAWRLLPRGTSGLRRAAAQGGAGARGCGLGRGDLPSPPCRQPGPAGHLGPPTLPPPPSSSLPVPAAETLCLLPPGKLASPTLGPGTPSLCGTQGGGGSARRPPARRPRSPRVDPGAPAVPGVLGPQKQAQRRVSLRQTRARLTEPHRAAAPGLLPPTNRRPPAWPRRHLSTSSQARGAQKPGRAAWPGPPQPGCLREYPI